MYVFVRETFNLLEVSNSSKKYISFLVKDSAYKDFWHRPDVHEIFLVDVKLISTKGHQGKFEGKNQIE